MVPIDHANPCLHRLFEEQARRTPQASAVVDPQTSLTYEELDRRANLLAGYLRERGVGPDEVVGVYMDKRVEYVVACLAAMKAGGAFLPLEMAYPRSMIEEVLADAEPRVVLTQRRYEENLTESQARFCMDEGWEDGLDGGAASEPEPTLDNLAFVSYSSGTTGKPKGIANPHRAPVGSYLWRFGVSDYRPGDRVACNVFFIWEIFRPLLRGGTTVTIPDDVIYDPVALLDFLEKFQSTEVLMTPSLLEAVLNVGGEAVGEKLTALKTLWLNGEVVTRTLARRVLAALPETRALNGYSISETHEVAAGDLRELVDNPHSTHCPVGQLRDPDLLYILDEDRNPLPVGEAGEVYVGGEGLARGYVNRPETTAERFTENPFSPDPEARMYRTGDKGRLLPDGNLEILGRVDFMVKVRGYSIELGAVEAAIEENLAVYNCVVIAEGAEGEDKRLVAYLVPDAGEPGKRHADWNIDSKTGRSPDIRRALQSSLPHYAIPAVYVELETLPLQATTGKVDRAELPEPPPRVESGPREPVEKLSPDVPRPEKEALLVRLFEDVLRLDAGDVERDDDFFDVGGHSLAAAELLSGVEEAFGARLSVNALLQNPTVAGLCDVVEAALREGTDVLEANVGPDLFAEATLDPDIAPDGPAEDVLALHRSRRIFLTGATGFLGAFLLDSLLLRTQATVYCLVRPPKDGNAMTPIRENLRHYGLWRAGRERRIVPVPGDLGEPLLGIPEEKFETLAHEVDVVIHAAARVNLVYPYDALKPANVDGTREVLRLACRSKTKALHFVSTNGIFPPGGHKCEEDADLDALAGAREDGYGQTKWVAEKLVRQAADRGLPVSVYRPGNIAGHSISGVSNPRDFLGAVIAESLRIGAAPRIEGWRMEMTPVDFVSGAICHLADKPESAGRTFHLAEPDPLPADRVFGWFGEMGYPLEQLDYPDWLETWRSAPNPEKGGGVVEGVLSGAAPEAHELWDGNLYDDSNTRQVLEKTGLRRPDLNPSLLGNYARHFADRGWV
ncbi:MAG TPA: amino acid adenylation domain-containing protein [Rubrobacteraceae bacterium]|nr:amino acid adenylation domain-containing protein [Rubrobacteraceae bacterium]